MGVAVQIVGWVVALAWVVRVVEAHRGLPRVPDLLQAEYDLKPAGLPSVTVIVPARNEGKDIAACLESLMRQDYAGVRVLAVDDRSTDETGATMDEMAGRFPEKLSVLHVRELPAGWLGKTHAMAKAADVAGTEFLLFTDGDILFREDAVRRALANAVATGADHLVLVPTTIIHRWDEAGLLSFFQIFGLWAARPWKVADETAQDAIGIGAFNLIRAEAYRKIGGFESFPMEIVEDLGLARRVKWAGLKQRVAVGRGMVRVHWAAGVRGLIGVMTKNVFSAFNFHISLLLLGCLWLTVFCVAPFFALLVPGLRMQAIVSVVAIAYAYVLMSRPSGLSPWNVLLAPFAASLFVYTLLRSMVATLARGGVMWRDTFYSLRELRSHTVPLVRRRR